MMICTPFIPAERRFSLERRRPDCSLLVADDVGDVIWRVTGERQG
jgi:glucose/arabinose dehydrogenase